jgi:hypothetical protein
VVTVVFTHGFSALSFLVIIVVLIAALGAWMYSGFPLWGDIKPGVEAKQRVVVGPPSATAGETGARPPPLPAATRAMVELPEMLDYRTAPHYRQMAPVEPTNYWAAVGGFFLALGVCAGGFYLLIMSLAASSSAKGLSALPLVLIAIAIGLVVYAGVYFGKKKGWRGFMPGIAIGLGLGLMVLGPCGFCYLIGVVAS